MTDYAQQIEAYLFANGDAVNKEELVQLVQVGRSKVDEILEEITHNLAGHGIALLNTDTHAQIVTSPSTREFINTVAMKPVQGEPSRALMETLSIIAYRGPISRYEVEVIRGVDCQRTLRGLLHSGLIERSSQASPPLYDITQDFLSRIGITHRRQLPKFDSLSINSKIEDLIQKVSSP